MNKPDMTSSRRSKREREHEFYEFMAATADRYSFADPADEELARERELEHGQALEDTKLTAVITIVLTAVVAMALGLLFLRGLDTIKQVTPAQTGASTEL
jgi:hypothetical protein